MSLSRIVRITSVEEHPDPTGQHLSIMRHTSEGQDYQAVSMKVGSGSDLAPRYQVGDLVLFVYDKTVVPENLLREGFWDHENGRGILGGNSGGLKGNRVKASNFKGVRSEGIMFPVSTVFDAVAAIEPVEGRTIVIHVNDDYSALLGLTASV